MKTRLLTSIDESAWDAFVLSNESGSIYHTSAWARCVSMAFGVRPLWLAAEEPGGGFVAGLPLGIVHGGFFGTKLSSFPCAQYCGPLVKTGAGLWDFKDALLSLKDRTRAGKVEIRVRRPVSDACGSAQGEWSYCTHDVDLAPPEGDLLLSFHKSCIQRPLRSAETGGMRFRAGSSEAEIRRFYRLYSSMRKSKGLLPAPERFFHALRKTVMQDGGGEVMSATHDGNVVSSILMLYHGKTAIYEYGATRGSANSLHPSQFLLWEAMKRAKARGCTLFNLGRTGRDNQGLIQYKQRWGARLVPLENLDAGGAVDRRTDLGVARSALEPLMNAVVRILPVSACVLVGDLVYGKTI